MRFPLALGISTTALLGGALGLLLLAPEGGARVASGAPRSPGVDDDQRPAPEHRVRGVQGGARRTGLTLDPVRLDDPASSSSPASPPSSIASPSPPALTGAQPVERGAAASPVSPVPPSPSGAPVVRPPTPEERLAQTHDDLQRLERRLALERQAAEARRSLGIEPGTPEASALDDVIGLAPGPFELPPADERPEQALSRLLR